MGGGVVLSLGNLSSQYAFAFVGLSVTEVITASITVVIGNSITQPLHDNSITITAPNGVWLYKSHYANKFTNTIKCSRKNTLNDVCIGYLLIISVFCDDFQLVPLLNYSTIFVPIVTGTTLNYFLDDKINKAEILFPGVGCFLIAVFLGSAVHSSNASDNKAKLNNYSSDYKEAAMYVLFASDNMVYTER